MQASEQHCQYSDNTKLLCYTNNFMQVGEAESYLVGQKVHSPHNLSSNGGSEQKDVQLQIFNSEFSTLESSSVPNQTHLKHHSPSSVIFPATTDSPQSQQDSHLAARYDSPVSGSSLTEEPNGLKLVLKEIESVMLGPDSDIDESYTDGHFPLEQDNWWLLMDIPRGDLKQALVACAKAVDENDDLATDMLITELKQMVSVSGEPLQRLGAYMLEGLIARLASSGSKIYNSLRCKEPTSPELLSYMHLLYEICPYYKFGYMSANGAIAEAVKGESYVHIIDFQIAQGSQWLTLIQALAAMPGGPPRLRVTGIDDDNSAHARGGGLHLVGQRLANFSESCGIHFEFNAIRAASHEVELQHLDIRPHEVLAVNFAYQLHHTPDESVTIKNPRDRILRMVKSLSPRVVTLVEQESNTNTAPFFPRFLETLDYYTAMFESIDVALPRDNAERISVEQHCVARDIVNLIACEGADRVERHELYGKWKSRFSMAGFRPYPLSSLVNGTIKKLLGSYCSDYWLEERDGVLYLGWKNRPLVVSSAWR